MGSTFLNHNYFNLFGNFHYEYNLSILITTCQFTPVSRQIRHAAPHVLGSKLNVSSHFGAHI